jgi:hypothetical protein
MSVPTLTQRPGKGIYTLRTLHTVCNFTIKNNIYNKHLPMQLIFSSYNTDSRENDASNISSIGVCVFVAAGTRLPSRCLSAIGGTHKQTAKLSHERNLIFPKIDKEGQNEFHQNQFQVSLVSFLTQKYVRSPCWYY